MKYFISHSYADAGACDLLIANLPSGIEPIMFPPITVSPNELVSADLLTSISACDGLIYLEGGHSDQSFWVAFERDFALRTGKRVLSSVIGDYELTEHVGGPLDLATFASYHRKDQSRINEMVEFLRTERNFDLWFDQDLQPGDDFAKEIELSINERLQRGGYVIVFWSQIASESGFIKKEISTALMGMGGKNDRVIFAQLDDTPLPEFWLQFQEPAVQLYGDEERSERNRIDDLVVSLYWLIYRKTQYHEY